jgi:hypothetical protein
VLETVKEGFEQAIFGMPRQEWVNYWFNYGGWITRGAAIYFMGYAVKFLMEAMNAGRMAKLMKFTFIVWSLSTLMEGCKRG